MVGKEHVSERFRWLLALYRKPDGTEKRGTEVSFKESTEGGIRCRECADGE